MTDKRKKLALVCTIGGHFEQMTNLSDLYSACDHFWITNRNRQTSTSLANEQKYFVPLAHYKAPWTYVSQLPVVLKAFLRERPSHVLSTGSGRTALVPFLLAKIFRVPFLHIDTFSRVTGFSKFGSFLVGLHQKIFCQWQSKDIHAVYVGPIFKATSSTRKPAEPSHVFVTVGTRQEPFARLLSAVDQLVAEGCIKDKVIVQAGHTKYPTRDLEMFEFCSPEKIDDLILRARYVITQESAGVGTKCLKSNTRFIVMPRDYAFGELPARSDMEEDLHVMLESLGYTTVVHNVDQLRDAINKLESIKTGYLFDNTLAITTLREALEVS